LQGTPQQKNKPSFGFIATEDEEEHDVKVLVYYDQERFVEVGWSSKNLNLTVGWLISEILRTLSKEADFNRRTPIIGFKNTDQKASECYDYLLTMMESSISFIQNGDCLTIVSPPSKKSLGSFSPTSNERNSQ